MNARLALALLTLCSALLAQDKPAQVKVDWDKVLLTSRTTATLQVVVNPPLRRGSAIHDPVWKALKDLGADYVRFVPWLPYPRLAVAELEPPKDGKTSWDFSLIDLLVEDFLGATAGHPSILNLSTMPAWMWKTDKPVTYPADPNQPVWNYTRGTEPVDPTFQQIAEYYARVVSWYTQGGFTDELGVRHTSGHHYDIAYWEVLNEVEFEHNMSPETYSRLYDEVTAAIHKVSPQTKFVGLALALPSNEPQYFEYFLNHANHKPGTPLDAISYHFYASPTEDQDINTQSFTYWEQADRFLATVRYIEAIRKRLSPETKTFVDELGVISWQDNGQEDPKHVTPPIPDAYWQLCGAMYAYLYGELSRMGIEQVGESQLVGYPTQFPTVSMVDWNSGKPNARFWVLKLLHDNFAPGDKLIETDSGSPYLYARAFVTRGGAHKVLLVNKRNRALQVAFETPRVLAMQIVDQQTGFGPPRSAQPAGSSFELPPLAVAVVTLP